ncbi:MULTISPECIES: polysaccharide biosynthesis protein [Paraliobacillus]|uniref:putative polysaccharide biosynthesis protein n=1 Tax=Paraliobacillus TaxID=200903 RepID=UPI000DD40CFB|nr:MULTISPECIES: polysaccharide biosynthesis protein [Paraliobacillus]
MSKSTILRGTILLTAATFFSKLIGMIYTIPFESLVGPAGGQLYSLAYVPYSIFISLSTVGIPLAVSKFVSKYNSLGDYQTSRRMYKLGLRFMAVMGIIAFLVMFFGAEILAKISLSKDSEVTVADATSVIKMISFALIIIPAMSITRGFFQGHQSMGPTAISQVIEQIVRIVFLLGAVFIIIEVIGGTTATAVGFATFSAFIGAIASALVLFWYWKRRKPYLDKEMSQQVKTYDISTKDLFKELFRYAGPFVLVGLAIPLYQQIDLIMIDRTLSSLDFDELVRSNAIATITLYGHKIVMIPITLATGLSLATLPVLTKSFVDNKKGEVFKQINQSLQIIMLLILPAVVGMSFLGNEIWGAFYGVSKFIELNGSLLSWYAPVALFFALFTVTASILQGINQQNYAVISLTAGIILKVLLTIPFLHLMGAKGAVIATLVASLGTVILNMWRIKGSIQFPLRQLIKRSMLISIFTVVMAIIVLISKWILSFWITYQDGRLENVFILFVTVTAGGFVYLWLSYQSTLLERVLGGRIRVIDKFKRRKHS